MTTPFPKLCRDCKWSSPEKHSEWSLRCSNPVVNADDPWALSGTEITGTSCRAERERTYSLFAVPCGKSGKLWEAK